MPYKNLYVAGGWPDRKEIFETMILPLVEKRFHITHDWTQTENKSDTPDAKRWYADLDIDAVRRADAIIVHMRDEKYPYRGTWTEIGAALALKKPVYVYTSENLPHNIFLFATEMVCYTDLDEMLSDIYLAR